MEVTLTFSMQDEPEKVRSLLKELLLAATSSRQSIPASIPIASTNPASPIDLGSPEEISLSLVWTHLGKESKRFLKTVYEFCKKNEADEFTLSEIASEMGVSLSGVRANNRNIHRALKKEGTSLFKKRWDYKEGCQTYEVSKILLTAMAAVVNGE